MVLREIIRSCSHPIVAEAALRSLGGATALRVASEAASVHRDSGAHVAERVRDFAAEACVSDWRALARAIRGADQPVLAGLKHILESAPKSADDQETDDAGAIPAWLITAMGMRRRSG